MENLIGLKQSIVVYRPMKCKVVERTPTKSMSFEPELNQRPKDNCPVNLQSSALPTELSKGQHPSQLFRFRIEQWLSKTVLKEPTTREWLKAKGHDG